jgi:hypothetical protein
MISPTVCRNVAKYETFQSLVQLPRTRQAVEKVVVGPIGSLEQPQNTSKLAQNTTKSGFKALERRSETSTRGFFNTLAPSTHFGE